MSALLEKALQKVGSLPKDEQDAIASQILASLADEEEWKKRFAEKRDILLRMAGEAADEDEAGQTLPLPVVTFTSQPRTAISRVPTAE